MKPTIDEILDGIAQFKDEEWSRVRKNLEHLRMLPDWMQANDAFIVTHRDMCHIVHARTADDAINHLRYRFYGCAETEDLPPFSAVLAPWCDAQAVSSTTRAGKRLNRAEMLRRLSRMAS